MTDFNWKWIGYLFIVILMLVGVQVLLVASVQAASQQFDGYMVDGVPVVAYHDNMVFLSDGRSILLDINNMTIYKDRIVLGSSSNESTIAVSYDSIGIAATSGYDVQKSVERITQGQCVALNNTYDISGLGWNQGGISYYGRYYDDFSPSKDDEKLAMLKLPYTITKLSEYFIDPLVFGTKLGYWYVDYDSYERAGNSRLFYVNYTCPQYVETMAENNTILEVAKQPQYPLPQKYAAPVLLARGDSLAVVVNESESYWLFGNSIDFSIYDHPITNNLLIVDSKEMMNFATGDYVVDIISSGPNKILEEAFDNKTIEIVSPLRSQSPLSVFGIQPKLVDTLLKKRVAGSIDDTIVSWNIDFQEPDIQVTGIKQESDKNGTYLEIKGYTNVRDGTILTLRLDNSKMSDITRKANTATTVVLDGGGFGYWRQFKCNMKIAIGSESPGQHDMLVTSPQGAVAIVPFYIRSELAAHYQQPEYIQYVDNSPFLPTPTPIVKEVVKQVNVPGPVQTVVKELAPTQEQVDKAFWNGMLGVIMYGVGILALVAISGYLMFVWVRSMKRRN